MTIKKWLVKNREIVFKKYGREIERVDFELPNGEIADYYIKKEEDTVCILALTKSQEIILAKQFRPGSEEILLELPGGGIDGKETPEQAALRELLEETGYAGKVQFVVEALDCGYSTRRRHCFVATECEKVADIQNTASEQTEVILMSFTEFRTHLRSGQLTDIEVGYLGLDFLGLL